MKKIRVITASSGANLKLANSFHDYLKSIDTDVELLDLTLLDLPIYTPRNQEELGVPKLIGKELKALQEVQAFVFIAPEYNGGLPPVLTNYIAWISVSGDKGWRASFNNKPAVIATHSGSGGTRLLESMRVQLSYLGVNVLGRSIHTHYNKELKQESLEAVCNSLKDMAI